ncbi:MAG: DUF309 domain-containing protein [Candidatus Tectomicrobia bacterium]|nr:DUF309 domain-containing protein [Candidatus Tectomicrobia bacterium]
MPLREPIPRYRFDDPFPPYAFVGGYFPHPVRNRYGHSYGLKAARPPVPDPERWQECAAYLRGIDLFNHGYYWEAHEEWESLWHACGKRGCLATFLEGLIKLAASGVKVRQGRLIGIQHHSRRAEAHFREVMEALGPTVARYMGLPLRELIDFAREIHDKAEQLKGDPTRPVEIVFPFVLRPE